MRVSENEILQASHHGIFLSLRRKFRLPFYSGIPSFSDVESHFEDQGSGSSKVIISDIAPKSVIAGGHGTIMRCHLISFPFHPHNGNDDDEATKPFTSPGLELPAKMLRIGHPSSTPSA